MITTPGIRPRIRAHWNVRIPDLVVTCERPDRHQPLVTQPVLAVEILSPSSEADSWANVWAYTSIPSVHEILVVQSLQVDAELLRRLPGGDWPADFETLTDGAARVRLDCIGAEFGLAEFYDTTDLSAAGLADGPSQ